MSTKANTTKIGIFIILAVLLLIAGLLAFGAKSYFVHKNRAETAISGDVYGLTVGSVVQLRGVPIGKVTQITFAWNIYPESTNGYIIVVFEIEGDLLPLPPGKNLKTATAEAVRNGLRAIVRSQGITGTSILALERLDPKEFPPLPIDYTPRYSYIPSAPPQLTRIIDSLTKSLNRIQEIDFASLGREATNTLATLRTLLGKLNQIDYAALGTNANALLENLKVNSVELNATIGDVHKTIDGMELQGVSKNVNGLITELRETNVKLRVALDKVDKVPMQQTAADLQQALQSFNQVLDELKDYPSGFIFGKPPPRVKGMEPEQK